MTPQEFVRRLAKNGWKIACAESCTGGLFAKTVTDVPGASEVFEYGAVVYSNRVKSQLLSVRPETIRLHTEISEEVARELAKNITIIASSDFGVGITGLAGPGGGTPEHPVGQVFVCVYRREDDAFFPRELSLTGSRVEIRQKTVDAVYEIWNEIL